VLALDVPSGLDADTGAIVGPDGVAVTATHTITFLGNKPGLHTGDGCDHAGLVASTCWAPTACIRKPRRPASTPSLFATPGAAPAQLAQGQLRRRRGARRRARHGRRRRAGGARGAVTAGAGRVFRRRCSTAAWRSTRCSRNHVPRRRRFRLRGAHVVAGPGMGSADAAIHLFGKALDARAPLVVDADALNLAAAGRPAGAPGGAAARRC
jgi:hypothetical protein